MKTYRNPKPKPEDKNKKGDGKVYAGGTPGFDMRGKRKSEKLKKAIKKFPGDQFAPKFTKPSKSRRRFLDELNEMNKRSR